MKKRFFAGVLSLVMLLSLLPATAFAADDGNVAKVGDQEYATLAEAFAAVHKITGDDRTKENVITLLRDAEGGGVGAGYASIEDNTTKGNSPVNITLNLNNHKYTVTNPTVGSSGTETNGFQFLKGSTVTIKDGTIESAITGILIQNYSNLTIENVDVTATNAAYVMSNNYGTVNITGDSSITANNNKYAFDVCATTNYPEGVTVNVNTTGTITGKVLYDVWDAKPEENNAKLNVTNGTFVGDWEIEDALVDDAKKNFTISGGKFSDTSVEAFVVDGKVLDSSGNVVDLSSSNAVAEINGTYYKTLAEAVSAAKDGDTVKLLKDATVESALRTTANLTVDLGGNTLTRTNSASVLSSYAGQVTIQNGTINGRVDAYDSAAVTIASNAIVNGLVVVWGDGTHGTDGCKTPTLNVYGTIKNPSAQAISTNGTDYSQPNINIYKGANISGLVGMYIPNAGTINITGGTITGESSAIAIKCGTLNISGGTLTATGPDSTPTEGWSNGVNASGAAIQIESNDAYKTSSTATTGPVNVSITGGTITSKNGYAIYEYIGKSDNTALATDTHLSKLEITAGNFSGGKGCFLISEQLGSKITSDSSKNSVIQISGGLYSSKVDTAFCTGELAAVPNPDGSTNSEYPYMIGTPAEQEAAVAAGEPKVATANNMSGEQKAAAESVANALSATTEEGQKLSISGDGLNAAAELVARNNTVNAEDYASQLKDAIGSNGDLGDTYVVVEHYMDIQITDVETSSESDTKKIDSITLDITPMYRKVVTTVNPNDDSQDPQKIVTEADADAAESDANNTVNAYQIEAKPLTVNAKVTITIPLPASFVGNAEKMYVQHKSYEYEATVLGAGTTTIADDASTEDATRSIQFENPHGFSAFIIKANSDAVATIGDTRYTTLQAAVDAVENGETITLLANGRTAEVSRNVTFKVVSTTGQSYTAEITGGSRTTVTKTEADGITTYTCTRSSGSGGGVTTYAITTNSPANGTVTVSPKSAAKDATVTLTVTPASGYQLDKLTVVDKDGKGVVLTDKGNGTYTFTMPASKVDVTATFKQTSATHVCPAEKFIDVDTTQWYHEGVDYVIANGMMNGTGTNTFEPNATTTRGMIVTILYRLEKEPTAGTSPFTDVDANQWYAKAVAWAAANGVVNGTSPTTFNPNDPITREQMAAILYRYASFKGYDVTGKADLAGFTDATQISDYAKDAMSWANQEGLIGGVSADTLQPQGSATRAQVATILMRFCENVAK